MGLGPQGPPRSWLPRPAGRLQPGELTPLEAPLLAQWEEGDPLLTDTLGLHRAATTGFSLPALFSASGLEGRVREGGGHLCCRPSWGLSSEARPGSCALFFFSSRHFGFSLRRGSYGQPTVLGAGKLARFWENTGDPEVLSVPDRGGGSSGLKEKGPCQRGPTTVPCCLGYP